MAAFAFEDCYDPSTGTYTGQRDCDTETEQAFISAIKQDHSIMQIGQYNYVLGETKITLINRAGHMRTVIVKKMQPIAWILALFPEIVEQRNRDVYVSNKLWETKIATRILFHGSSPDEVANSCGLVIDNMMKIEGFYQALVERNVLALDAIAKKSEQQVRGDVESLLKQF